MESHLFDFLSADMLDFARTQYEECTAKVQIGTHPPGTVIPFIVLNMGDATLDLYSSEGQDAPDQRVKVRLEIVRED